MRELLRIELIASVDRTQYETSDTSPTTNNDNFAAKNLYSSYDLLTAVESSEDSSESDTSNINTISIDNLVEGVVDAELARYNKETPLETNSNPLEWWKNKMKTYPIIANVARRYLGIPASSASVERLFSVAGLTISDDRGRLSAEHASQLIFLRASWKPLEEYLESINQYEERK